MTTAADPPIVRHSIFERIAWTNILDPTDQRVLQALATFGNYKTGRKAYASHETLADRCRVHRRTIIRSLKRLENTGYLIAYRRHKQTTVYDIRLHRLAIDMRGTVLSDTAVTQDADPEGILSDRDVTQKGGLSDTDVTQRPILSDKSGQILSDTDVTRSYSTYGSSSTYDPPIQDDPPISTSALCAEFSGDDENPTPEPPKVRPIAGSGNGHQRRRRKRLLQKALRTLIDDRGHGTGWVIPWEDYKAVELALRTFLRDRHILNLHDYSQSDFHDAISEVDDAMRATAGRRFAHA